MNREIKFRGQRVDNGEWVYGDLIQSFCEDKAYIDINHCFDIKHILVNPPIEVDKETVGQFTGLKDKSGKEIYEGDFIRLKYPNDLRIKTNAIILFDYGTNSLRFKVYESTELYVLYNHLPKYLDFEVIGNIKDNPELLVSTPNN